MIIITGKCFDMGDFSIYHLENLSLSSGKPAGISTHVSISQHGLCVYHSYTYTPTQVIHFKFISLSCWDYIALLCLIPAPNSLLDNCLVAYFKPNVFTFWWGFWQRQLMVTFFFLIHEILQGLHIEYGYIS